MNTIDLEHAAVALEASGRYRVLRKLQFPTNFSPVESGVRVGVCVDFETTGLDPARNEIIEIGMLPFYYSNEGQVCGLGQPFSQLRQPATPIPAEITALTGITDQIVAGKSIDPENVAAFIAPASLVIAHNAAFDRRFAERFCGAFADKPWACSMSEIDWRAEGFDNASLAYLASAHSFYYERHRAVNDCAAAVELLTRPLSRSGQTGLERLLAAARTSTWRIFAENSPFELKDVLKARRYRWNNGDDGGVRSWWKDVAADQKEAEIKFLRTEIYQADVTVSARQMTAYERFSDRP